MLDVYQSRWYDIIDRRKSEADELSNNGNSRPSHRKEPDREVWVFHDARALNQ